MERMDMGRVRILSLLYISGALPLTTWMQRASNGLIFVAVVMGFTYLTIDLIQPNLAGDLSLHN
jgi:hypothetical protein